MKLCPAFRLAPLAVAVLGLSLAASVHSQPARLPVDAFFTKPLVYSPSLSPDGKTIAYALRDEQDKDQDDYALSVLKLEKMESKNLKLAGRSTFPFFWMDKDRLVLGAERQGYSVFHLSKMKAYSFNPREALTIISARHDDPGLLNVVFYEGDESLRAGLAIIDPARSIPDSMTAINQRYNVKKWVDVPSGERGGFAADWQGRVRLAVIFANNQLRYHYRPDEKSPWQELPLDVFDFPFFAFHPDLTKIYVVARIGDEPTAGIHLYDVNKHVFLEEVWSDPEFSMTEASAAVSAIDGTLLGLHYQKDMPASHWFSAPLQAVQAAADAKFAGLNNRIIDYDDALEHFLIAASADRSPPFYFLYDKTKGTFAGLPDPFPALRKAPLAGTQSIRYKARDGLRLQGYLTLPAARADGAKPPLVVLVHGGPWVRDTWGYNPEVQFLASRGYAVFQPNYRGSSGFNDAVSVTNRYDFRIMHDDVTDGVKALMKSGRIDPQRIAIMGASHGGYLSVSGVAFEPDLYKCAVTIVGVFDWAKRIKDRSGYRFDRSSEGFFLQRLGDPDTEAAKFAAISPINYVDQIKVPVYVSAGKDDSNVDASQSTKLVSALKKNGVPVETFFPETEGHGYFKTKNNLRLYREIDAFLAKYL